MWNAAPRYGAHAKPPTGVGPRPSGSSAPGLRGAATGTRSIMPMGVGAQSSRRKSHAIKTVTPELEQEANIKAIVGEAPPMVPGTIGDWARR